jgi:hypothetical protein
MRSRSAPSSLSRALSRARTSANSARSGVDRGLDERRERQGELLAIGDVGAGTCRLVLPGGSRLVCRHDL